MDFKDIHIGRMIKIKVAEKEIELSRICNFLPADEQEILKMYESKDLGTQMLLRWCKLLEYDFFRIYSQHLILFAPPGAVNADEKKRKAAHSKLPAFRKNLYTQEVIDFILELIQQGKKTNLEVMQDYHIPKTTLYRWMKKKEDHLTKTNNENQVELH